LKWITTKQEDLYAKQMTLRERVLFTPFGLTLADVSINEDAFDILTAWDRDECIGTMLFLEEDAQTSRMRFVAVAPERQK
jgi:hypothetical protein